MDAYLGEIRLFSFPLSRFDSGNVNWLYCDGSLISINAFKPLYDVIGTHFGGDGSKTFALPDLRGRVPIHFGTDSFNMTYAFGAKGGVETVTLTPNQLPTHTHKLRVAATTGNRSSPKGNVLAAVSSDTSGASAQLYGSIIDNNVITLNGAAISAVGIGRGHNNIQPSCVLAYYICAQGGCPIVNISSDNSGE